MGSLMLQVLTLVAVPCVLLLAVEVLPGFWPALLAWSLPAPEWLVAMLCLGGLLGLAFRRSRMFLAMLMLAIAGWALQRIAAGPVVELSRDAIYRVTSLLLPLGFGLLAISREFSLFSLRGLIWLAAAAGAPFLGRWCAQPEQAWLEPWLRLEIIPGENGQPVYLSQPALAAFGLAALLTAIRWLRRRSPLDRGLLWALMAAGFGMQRIPDEVFAPIYFWAAGLILVVSVLQEGYSMAYLDELTELPARRALIEEVQRLGRRYVLAMLDVDHFKNFNDTYGHDVGDQVLRFIATKMKRVGGGGRAFRYGGEEFTILFSGKSAEQVLESLESLRRTIQDAQLTIRAQDRPKRKPKSPRPRGGSLKQVSVTVSIGVAGRAADHRNAFEVLEEADKALYRAKQRGRNQVCFFGGS